MKSMKHECKPALNQSYDTMNQDLAKSKSQCQAINKNLKPSGKSTQVVQQCHESQPGFPTPQCKSHDLQTSHIKSQVFFMNLISKSQPRKAPEYHISLIRVSNTAQSSLRNISNHGPTIWVQKSSQCTESQETRSQRGIVKNQGQNVMNVKVQASLVKVPKNQVGRVSTHMMNNT